MVATAPKVVRSLLPRLVFFHQAHGGVGVQDLAARVVALGEKTPSAAGIDFFINRKSLQLPAVLWWKVSAKKLEYQIGVDNIGREKEAGKVKYVVPLVG